MKSLIYSIARKYITKVANRGVYIDVNTLPPTLRRALKEVGYGKSSIELKPSESYHMISSPGDGYRAFALALNLETGQSNLTKGSWGGANIFEHRQVDRDDKSYPIPYNHAVIVGWEGGSKPVYAYVYVHPDNMNLLIPSASENELSAKEQLALNVIGGIKSGYRQDEFQRKGLGLYSNQNPILQSLATKGLIAVTGQGIKITTKGKNLRSPY